MVTFVALVTDGGPMVLGSISGDATKTEKKKLQIIEILSEFGFSFRLIQ
jgi:hypothetical protein